MQNHEPYDLLYGDGKPGGDQVVPDSGNWRVLVEKPQPDPGWGATNEENTEHMAFKGASGITEHAVVLSDGRKIWCVRFTSPEGKTVTHFFDHTELRFD